MTNCDEWGKSDHLVGENEYQFTTIQPTAKRRYTGKRLDERRHEKSNYPRTKTYIVNLGEVIVNHDRIAIINGFGNVRQDKNLKRKPKANSKG